MRSGSRASTDRDRIRCYTCREYDHFARDCLNSREERNLEQLQQMLNMEEQGHKIESSDEDYKSPLNLWMVGMTPQHSYHQTFGDQTRYIYKKVETGEMINTDTIQQEIEQEKQLNRIDDKNGEINLYRELIVNNAERTEPLITLMGQWSTLSNVLNYVQHSKFNSMNHTLNVKAVNRYKVKLDMEREFKELDFGSIPQKLQEEYLDVYEGIQSDIVNSSRFDETCDIITTYLGRIKNMESQDKLKAEESYPISENGYTLDRLLGGTIC